MVGSVGTVSPWRSSSCPDSIENFCIETKRKEKELFKLLSGNFSSDDDLNRIKELLRDVDVNFVNKEGNYLGFTPLHIAVYKRSEPLCGWLLEHGASLTKQGGLKKEIPLELARRCLKMMCLNVKRYGEYEKIMYAFTG